MILPVRDAAGRLVGHVAAREDTRVGDDVLVRCSAGTVVMRCLDEMPRLPRRRRRLLERCRVALPYLALPAGVDPARLPLLPVEGAP